MTTNHTGHTGAGGVQQGSGAHDASSSPPAASQAPATSHTGGPASDKIMAAASEIVSYIQGEPARTKAALDALPIMKQYSDEARKQALMAEVTKKIQAAVDSAVQQITGITPPKPAQSQSQSSAPQTHAA